MEMPSKNGFRGPCCKGLSFLGAIGWHVPVPTVLGAMAGKWLVLVREELICDANRPANDLHHLAVERVRATAQAQGVEKIMPVLSEEETAVFKRGRNAKSGHQPKNVSRSDYHMATAMETLFGYLYLMNRTDRILELYRLIYG